MHRQLNFTIYFVSGKHLSEYLQDFILVRKRRKKRKKKGKKKEKNPQKTRKRNKENKKQNKENLFDSLKISRI